MKNLLNRIFLNDSLIAVVIVVNSVMIFLQECGVSFPMIDTIDVMCTLLFIVEMVVKHVNWGFAGYWSKRWNRMDGVLTLLSIPSLVALFVPVAMQSLSFLLILRILRLFRFFRVMRAFPKFGVIMRNFWLALRETFGIMVVYFVLIITSALICCFLFRNCAPEYFGTPFSSIYSIFRMCTIEGWYEIPNAVSAGMPAYSHLIKFLFCMMLVGGGIIGMSLINSIFVDAMVSDNNDDVKEQLTRVEGKLDALDSELKELRDLLENGGKNAK